MGMLLVYDVTNPTSFNNLNKWLRNISEYSNDGVEKLILGNKCDMEAQRRIPKAKGESVAKENGIRFLETSAKANINIEEAFLQISGSILDTITDITQHSAQTASLSEPENKPSSNCCLR